ncbi:MAG: hypothetical protein Ta2A_13630 [Treponemataceae bacterium]|nr:MAG: hypothetical protein Ta2A_13630 [Treponemataceae bacterium]
MNIEYFNEFLQNEKLGIKTKAKEFVNKFIQSFVNYREKELWTIEYLPKLEENGNGRIRNELFEEIIFPVLLNGYNSKNISLMIWLAKLSQNYYQNKRIWMKMNYKSDTKILKECYAIEPNNTEIIDLYLELEINSINFSMHEWPSGILYGNDFATEDECKKLLQEIPFIHKLDRNKKYEKYLNEYENSVKEYMNKYSNKNNGGRGNGT